MAYFADNMFTIIFASGLDKGPIILYYLDSAPLTALNEIKAIAKTHVIGE